MKNFVFAALLLVSASYPGQDDNPCHAFQELTTRIRDGRITKAAARSRFAELLGKIRLLPGSSATECVFPVQGYNRQSIGGQDGNGYVATGYDYFDGNRHKAHPAHDIFIYDRNQDGKDDRTGKKVAVLSVCDGIVVAVEKNWCDSSMLRGGKYVWIYSKGLSSLFYYAHNDTVMVSAGDEVKAGEVIALVGRTGSNAAKKRSPTHLHFMQLKINADGSPRPVNPYEWLVKAG